MEEKLTTILKEVIFISEIKAGVVCVTKFITTSNSAYSKYIDYVDRDSAVRNEKYKTFNAFSAEKNGKKGFEDYHEYMNDPEKTSGLFTSKKDSLAADEKKALKESFSIAEKNNSVMWQTVFSFDMKWLAKNGIYSMETKSVDEYKLREVTRNAMKTLTAKEDIADSSVWCAAIHYNTAHVHVHIAMVEPEPTRPMMVFNGKTQYRGKFKQSSINSAKSTIVNQIIRERKDLIQTNEILRNVILGGKKERRVLGGYDSLSEMAHNLYVKLNVPPDKWNYNSLEMKPFKEDIDRITEAYLNKYHKHDMEQLKKAFEERQTMYTEAYGIRKDPSKQNTYAENKMNDLYTRMGNAILKELKTHEKESRAEYNKQLKDFFTKSAANKKLTPFAEFRRSRKILTGRFMSALDKTFNDAARQHWKNLRAYEQMQEQSMDDFYRY